MFANLTCPTCQHKYYVQEGEMGSQQICPKCNSLFFAGKSVAEARLGAQPVATAQPVAAAQPSYAKTMIGDMAPPIKYNCPRCKAPLEASASEAGTKKNCPNCTQRMQVPAQSKPEPVAPVPALNKTLLAGDESAAPPRPPIKYNCPNCKKPLEAPADQGGTKKNCPSCNQRLQIPNAPPGAPNRNKTMLAADESAGPAQASQGAYAAASTPGSGLMASGQTTAAPGPWAQVLTPRNVAIGMGALLVVLLLLVVPAVIRGGKQEDKEGLVRMQMELEKLKADIELKKNDAERQAKAEAEARQRYDEMIRNYTAQEEKRREAERRSLRDIADADQRAAAERKLKQEQQQREADRLEMERKNQQLLDEAKAKLEETKRALEASQKQQTIIQQQPPPVIYYPPYSPRYYWPYW